MEPNPGQAGPMSQENRENATGIQIGRAEDVYIGGRPISEGGKAELPENLYPSVTLALAPSVPESWQGRVQELQELRAWMADKGVLLAGIYGVGGYGKSTLAAKLMQEAEGFAGTFWGDLSRGITFSELARGALQAFLGLSREQVEAFPEQGLGMVLANGLREKRFLLVLDNLESLLHEDLSWRDESYAGFLQELWLGGYGGESLVLVTSQERPELRHPGVRWVNLAGLQPEEGMRLLLAEGIAGEAEELREFSQRVDGCPLALRLVAGLLRDEVGGEHPPLARFWDFHGEPLRAEGGHRGERLSTERLLEISFGRLGEKWQRSLLGASVYRQGFTLAAVRAQLPGEEISAAELRQLERRCLVLGKQEGEEWRYQFQPLVLGYLRGKLADREEAHRRALDFFTPQLQPQPWEEIGDIRAYFEVTYHWHQLGEYGRAFETIRACDEFMQLRGYNEDRRKEYEQLLAHWQPQTREEKWQYGASLASLGIACQALGQYRQAIAYHEQWLAIARDIGDRSGEAASLGNLGIAYHSLGQYSQAIAYHEQSLAIDRDIGDRSGEAKALGNLGNAYQSLGQYSQAIAYHEQSLTIKRDIGDRSGEANSLGGLGNAYYSLGQYQKAIDYHKQALAIARDIGDRRGEAASLGSLGNAYQSLGQYQKAIDYHEQWLAIARDIGDRSGEAKSLGGLGNAYQPLGQYQKAIDYHEQWLAIARDIGDRRGEANSLGNLGIAYYSLGQYSQAIAYLEQTLAIARDIGDRSGEANSLGNLGIAYQALGQYSQAIAYHEQHLAIARDIGDRSGEAKSLGNLGIAYDSLGQYSQAIAYHEQALTIACDIGDRAWEAGTLGNLGNAYYSLGQYSQAIALYHECIEIMRAIGSKHEEARHLRNLAIAYKETGKILDAAEASRQANQLLTELDLPTAAPVIDPRLERSYRFLPLPAAISRFYQRGKWQRAACFLVGLVAFPFALVALIAIGLWRLAVGRFRR